MSVMGKQQLPSSVCFWQGCWFCTTRSTSNTGGKEDDWIGSKDLHIVHKPHSSSQLLRSKNNRQGYIYVYYQEGNYFKPANLNSNPKQTFKVLWGNLLHSGLNCHGLRKVVWYQPTLILKTPGFSREESCSPVTSWCSVLGTGSHIWLGQDCWGPELTSRH